MRVWMAGTACGSPAHDFIAEAKRKHGAAGGKAADFLVEHMPATDKQALTTVLILP